MTDGETDRRTDGRTDRILLAIPRLHYMQRGKNELKMNTNGNLQAVVPAAITWSCETTEVHQERPSCRCTFPVVRPSPTDSDAQDSRHDS